MNDTFNLFAFNVAKNESENVTSVTEEKTQIWQADADTVAFGCSAWGPGGMAIRYNQNDSGMFC